MKASTENGAGLRRGFMRISAVTNSQTWRSGIHHHHSRADDNGAVNVTVRDDSKVEEHDEIRLGALSPVQDGRLFRRATRSALRNESTLLILDGPSGAGKTTVWRHVALSFPRIGVVRTFSTRPIRADDRASDSNVICVSERDFDEMQISAEKTGFYHYTKGKSRIGVYFSEFERIWTSRPCALVIITDHNLIARLQSKAARLGVHVAVIYLTASRELRRARLCEAGYSALAVEERLSRDDVSHGPVRPYSFRLDAVIENVGEPRDLQTEFIRIVAPLVPSAFLSGFQP